MKDPGWNDMIMCDVGMKISLLDLDERRKIGDLMKSTPKRKELTNFFPVLSPPEWKIFHGKI